MFGDDVGAHGDDNIKGDDDVDGDDADVGIEGVGLSLLSDGVREPCFQSRQTFDDDDDGDGDDTPHPPHLLLAPVGCC